jgi:cobalamin biosynthesis protein CobC
MLKTPEQTYNRPVFHGGDLGWAISAYGVGDQPWIDLSTGINPCAYPIPPLPNEAWTHLPEAKPERALLDAARSYYALPKNYALTPTPGTQSILQLLPLLRSASKVAIKSMTYAEHAHCWQKAGHEICATKNWQDLTEKVDICVIVNPNNPTAEFFTPGDIQKIRDTHLKADGLIIVDEAFMDVTPERSCCHNLQSDGLLVLKSFGKFFGLAGLRLGFVAGDPRWVSKLRDQLGPWCVSGPATTIGTTAFKDQTWQKTTRDRLQHDMARLTKLLQTASLKIAGRTGLFALTYSEQSTQIFEHLCQHQILTRPFPAYPGHIRFGLPHTEPNWLRLENTLKVFA